MKIIVHRGTKQIGGSVIELSTENSRIILDIGQELPDLHAENSKGKVVLPTVKGLYAGEKADIDAVFITHAHGDHIGLFPNINKDIPIYIGEKSCEIYNMTGRFTGSTSFIQATKFLEHTEPIIVGDFKIIPYLVDHSAYDAYAFVIYSEGKCVVYTGDIRDHGKKGILTKYFQKSIPLHPDALLMEGTLFGRIDEKQQTEDDIKEEASGVMSVTPGPVLVLQSSTNIDRLVAMYNAAKASDRLFVIDIFTANILSVIGGSVGSILKKARVIYPYHLTNKMFENNENELMYKFSKMKIKVEELNENPNYCLLIRSSMLGILKNLKSLEEGILIYSMWQGYKEKSDIKRMLDYVGQQNMEIINLHTSGHGGISTLKNIVDSCNPKRIIPIHTEWPERFQEVFEDVCLLKDGEELNLNILKGQNKNRIRMVNVLRGLSDQFMNQLQNGILKPFLEYVKKDSTTIMEIRNNYINIYYRGSNLVKISGEKYYIAEFDTNFISSDDFNIEKKIKISTKEESASWIKNIPYLKREIDFYKYRKIEREFQQLVIRENNFCELSNSTDYFICDMEYADLGRFDMIAVRWDSDKVKKKSGINLGLSFIEMKYMDKSLDDGSGIIKHLNDIETFLSDDENITKFKAEMKTVFNQKVDLGLIKNKHKIESFNNSKPEFILLLANHDPSSSILKRVLDKISTSKFEKFDLKFAVSTFMGYGLYSQNIYSFDDFKNRFNNQIFCD